MEKTELLNIYTATTSKGGDYLKITLVSGKGEAKRYYTTLVRLESDKKIKACIADGTATIKIPLSQPRREAKAEATDDLPF